MSLQDRGVSTEKRVSNDKVVIGKLVKESVRTRGQVRGLSHPFHSLSKRFNLGSEAFQCRFFRGYP